MKNKLDGSGRVVQSLSSTQVVTKKKRADIVTTPTIGNTRSTEKGLTTPIHSTKMSVEDEAKSVDSMAVTGNKVTIELQTSKKDEEENW